MNNPSGSRITFQPVEYGTISGIQTTNFSKDGLPFFINNEGDDNITLSVKCPGSDTFQDRVFREGYNINPVIEIEANINLVEGVYKLSWGK